MDAVGIAGNCCDDATRRTEPTLLGRMCLVQYCLNVA